MTIFRALWDGLGTDSTRASVFFWTMILLLGVSSRVWIFDVFEEAGLPSYNEQPGTDMETFLNWSRILVEEGRWSSDFDPVFQGSEPPVQRAVFHQSPLYPYLLAFAAKALSLDLDHGSRKPRAPGDTHEPPGYTSLLRIQQLLGLALLWPLHGILRRLSGLRVARLGTLLFLFSQASVFYEITLLRAVLLAFVYTFLVHDLLLLVESSSVKRYFSSGLWFGLAWLTKASSMVLLPVILAWLVWQQRSLGRRALSLRLAVLLAGIFLVLSPAILRNLSFDLAPMKFTTRGSMAYINGNSHLSYWDDSLPRESAAQQVSTRGLGWNIHILLEKRYNEKFFTENGVFVHDRRPAPGEELEPFEALYGLWRVMRLVWAEHTEEKTWLSRFLPMMGIKLAAFFNGFEVPNNVNLGLARKYTPSIDWFFLTPFAICSVFLAGTFFLVGRWKEPAVSLPLAFVLVYAASTIAFYFIGRFRFPVLPLMFVLGLAGLADFFGRWRERRHAWRSLGCLLLGVAVFCAWPRDVRGGVYQQAYEAYGGLRWNDYMGYSQILRDRGRWFELVAVSGEGLHQPGFERFLPLWSLHFEALARRPELEAVSPSLPHAVYYSFAAERLAIDASRSGRGERAADLARRALEVRELHGQPLQRARLDRGLEPWLPDAELRAMASAPPS